MESIVQIDKENYKIFYELVKGQMESQFLKKDIEYYTVMHKKTNQISYVFSGEGFIIMNDKQYKIKEGSLIFIPKNTAHSFVVNSEKMNVFHFHDPKDYLDNDIFVVKEGNHG